MKGFLVAAAFRFRSFWRRPRGHDPNISDNTILYVVTYIGCFLQHCRFILLKHFRSRTSDLSRLFTSSDWLCFVFFYFRYRKVKQDNPFQYQSVKELRDLGGDTVNDTFLRVLSSKHLIWFIAHVWPQSSQTKWNHKRSAGESSGHPDISTGDKKTISALRLDVGRQGYTYMSSQQKNVDNKDG